MANSGAYQIALNFMGSFAISIIEDLLKLDDINIIEAIEKFGKELQETIKNRRSRRMIINRIPEEVEVEVEE